MTAILERTPQPARPAIRRYSIMATLGNHYLILDDDGRPVPTVARRRGPVPRRDEVVARPEGRRRFGRR